MNLIDPLPHQVPFEKWLKARFPFIGTHKVRRDPNPFKPDNEWEYGSEVAQACYEAYSRGRTDELQERLRKTDIYQGSGG